MTISRLLPGRPSPLYAPDGGTAGSNAGGDPGAGAGAGAGTGSGAEWTPPPGLPAELVGKDPAETLNKLLPVFTETTTRANGLRDKLATLPKAPEKPELYTFAPAEKLKPFFQGDLSQHKGLNHARAVFHKHGIPDAAFGGIINDIYSAMLDSGDLAPPYDPKEELKTYQTAYSLDDKGLTAELADNEAFAKGLLGQLQGIPDALRKAAEAELMVFASSAGGNALLKAIKARLGDSGIRVPTESNGGQGGPLTEAELKKMSMDPRIDPANRHHPDPNKRYDEELRKKYDAGYAALAAARK